MATLTNTKKAGELVVREFDQLYNRESGTITNNTGATRSVAQTVGLPVKLVSGSWELALNADVATIDGLVVTDDPIVDLADAGTTPEVSKYSIITKGPCVINEDVIPATDPAGTTWTLATLKSTLEALGFKFVAEPSLTEVQTS